MSNKIGDRRNKAVLLIENGILFSMNYGKSNPGTGYFNRSSDENNNSIWDSLESVFDCKIGPVTKLGYEQKLRNNMAYDFLFVAGVIIGSATDYRSYSSYEDELYWHYNSKIFPISGTFGFEFRIKWIKQG